MKSLGVFLFLKREFLRQFSGKVCEKEKEEKRERGRKKESVREKERQIETKKD